MAWRFDGPLINALTRNWEKSAIVGYHERVRQQQKSIPASISGAFALIDTKATGLLTHVSMMIAGLGLIADHDIEKGVIVFEMGVYLLVAIGCLRCLTVFNQQPLATRTVDSVQDLGHELLIRRELYGVCIRLATIFTIVVLVTLPAMFFW